MTAAMSTTDGAMADSYSSIPLLAWR